MPSHTCSSLLQSQSFQDFSKLLMFTEVGQLDMHTSPQPRPQVGGAGQDVAQVLIPHELMAPLFEEFLDLPEQSTQVLREVGQWGVEERSGAHLGEAIAEASEHLLHVAPFLHANDPQVVLLVDPNQKGLVVIVPGDRQQRVRDMAIQPLLQLVNSGHTDQMPRPSGQSRAIPDASNRGETGLSNKKWSSISCCCSSSVMFFRA